MRVITLISGKQLGGTKQAFLDHTRMLSAAGVEVTPIIRRGSRLLPYCLALGDGLADRLVQLRFWRSRFPWLRAHAVRVLRRAITAVSPDLIVSHRQVDVPLLKAACPSIPVLAVAHGFNTAGLAEADYVLPVSQAVNAYLTAQGLAVPMTVLPNAIQVPKQRAYRLPGKTVTLGALAVFRRKKNLEMLIEVCQRLNDAGIPCRCLIGGAGHRRYWLQYLIWRKGVSQQVQLLPWVTDKDAFFDQIDVYCVSSHSETFNIALLEAMSRCVPVVATDCGGPGEIIQSPDKGCLVPPGDVDAFVRAVRQCVTQTSDTERITQQAYEHVLQTYDHAAVGPMLLAVCQQLMAANRSF